MTDTNLDWLPANELRQDKALLAREAESLLSNALLQAAFENVRASYMKTWTNSDRADTEKRELAYHAISALKDVETAVRVHLHNAKLLENRTAINKPGI